MNEFIIKNGFISKDNSQINGTLTANTITATTISATTLYGSGANLTGIGSGLFTGGTINGFSEFTAGLSATSISATTYYGDGSNLTGIVSSDTYVTGGTYSNGTATFTNNTGGTFNLSGFVSADTYVTGITYDSNQIILKQNNNQPDLNIFINVFSGLTVNGTISATTISGGTFYGNGSNLTGIGLSQQQIEGLI